MSWTPPGAPVPMPTPAQWLGAVVALVAMACVYAAVLAWQG